MKSKIQDWFVFWVAVCLFMLAIFILWTATSKIPILNLRGTALPFPIRDILRLQAALYLCASAFFLLENARYASLKIFSAAWLALEFFLYCGAEKMNGSLDLFNSLGNLDHFIILSPQTLESILVIFFGGVLGGSAFLLAWGWMAVRRHHPAKVAGLVSQT